MNVIAKIILMACMVGSFGQVTAQIKIGNVILDTITVATGLEVVTALEYGADGRLYIAERNGSISVVEFANFSRSEIFYPEDIHNSGEAGMMAMALHPDFLQYPEVFLYYTYQNKKKLLTNKLVKFSLVKGRLENPVILLDGIPAAQSENGAALTTDPKGKLILATGSANDKSAPQNTNLLNGKILRINLDGTIPSDNPSPDNYILSWGHANPTGIAWRPDGRLYEVESGTMPEDQELNLLQPNRNYGWPLVHGFADTPAELELQTKDDLAAPLFSYVSPIQVAGLAYYWQDTIKEFHNSLLMTTGDGQVLVQLRLNAAGDSVTAENAILKNILGRMSAITLSMDGAVFIGTANRVLNGQPVEGDDRVMVIQRIAEISSRQYLTFADLGVKVYPVPALTEVNIEFPVPPQDLRTIELLNSRGELMRSLAVTTENIYTIPREGLNPGTYLISLEFYGYKVTDTVIFK